MCQLVPQGSLGWVHLFVNGLRAMGCSRLVLYPKEITVVGKFTQDYFYIKLKLFYLEPEMEGQFEVFLFVQFDHIAFHESEEGWI